MNDKVYDYADEYVGHDVVLPPEAVAYGSPYVEENCAPRNDRLVPDLDAALAFLKVLRPSGPWVLTAIVPDGPTATDTFDEAGARKFIVTRNARGENIYFTGNLCGRVKKKPTKADMTGAIFLHTDDDPREGETPEIAKARILAAYDAHDPPPSIIVDSGNGLQGFWLFQEDYQLPEIEDVEERVAEIELRNKALAKALGTTPGTHNIERLLRLPGTVNYPGKAKLKKGRVACMARVVRITDARYWPANFEKADADYEQPKAEADEKSNSAGAELPPLMRSLLHVPANDSGGYPSRSELLFAFLTGCLRAKVDRDVIAKACLDSRGAIHQHCMENGGAPYVKRQIERAAKLMKEARGAETFTDVGNARRLVRFGGEDLRYVHAWRSWLIWHDGHWRRDEDGAIVRMAKATVEEMFTEASRINDEAKRTALRNYALKSQNAQRLAAMIKLAESESAVVLSVEKLDVDPYLLGVRNGVIELRSGKFRAARQEDYVTKLAGVVYDAAAKCPQWESFLEKIIGDAELIEYLKRATGYVLTGLTGDEVMFIPFGSGSNGKSTFIETVFFLMGDYAMAADASLLVTNKRQGGATPDLVKLHGRRLVAINETEQNDHLNESRVKFITSNQTITARGLYEGFIDFTPTHKTFMATNYKPIVKGTDEGIWRRIHLLPFVKVIPSEERDPNFRERVLLPELPGILNWAIDGLMAYWKVGLSPPAAVNAATDEYRKDMDIVGRWIEERCLLDKNAEETSRVLYEDYKGWADAEIGFYKKKIGFGRDLSSRADQLGLTNVEPKRGLSGWRGIRLRPPVIIM